MPSEAECPLCGARDASLFHRQHTREFLRCEICQLVFVPPGFHLSASEQRALYEKHENDPGDPRYRAFLSRLFAPVRARLSEGARGLDFGCGPGPTLSRMFRESSFACEEYDLLFADDRALLEARYDFIVSSEVFEHLEAPAKVVTKLVSMLEPRGWLGVMTKRLTEESAFANWHYIRDPTHVAFFADRTFAWIGARFGLEVHIESSDVVLMRRR